MEHSWGIFQRFADTGWYLSEKFGSGRQNAAPVSRHPGGKTRKKHEVVRIRARRCGMQPNLESSSPPPPPKPPPWCFFHFNSTLSFFCQLVISLLFPFSSFFPSFSCYPPPPTAPPSPSLTNMSVPTPTFLLPSISPFFLFWDT